MTERYESKFSDLEEASMLGNFILSTFLLSPLLATPEERPHTPESLEAAGKVNRTMYNIVYNKLKKMEKKGKRIVKVIGYPKTNTIDVDYVTRSGEEKHKNIQFTPNGTYINGELMRLDNDNLINKMRKFNSQFEN